MKTSHIHIKDFDKFMFHKTKIKNTFVKVVYSVLVVKLFGTIIKKFIQK